MFRTFEIMSVPLSDYSIPPPRLNMPPPSLPSGAASVLPLGPPPDIYTHPPPFPPPVPLTQQPPSLSPITVPPPSVTGYTAPPIDIYTPSSYSLPPMNNSAYSYHCPTYHTPPPTYEHQPRISDSKIEKLPYKESYVLHGNDKDYKYRARDTNLSKTRSQLSPRHDSRERERSYDSHYKHKFRESSRSHYRDSPSHSSHSSHSRERDRYSKEKHYDDRHEFKRRRYEYESSHCGTPYREYRSHSRSVDSQSRRSPSRHSYSPSRHSYSPSRRYHRSSSRRYSPDQKSHVSSREVSSNSRRDSETRKPLTDREKILEEYRKNYCKTSKDLIEKIEQWSKEHNSDEEEGSKMWYRSSPAELYYKPVEGGAGVQQTNKLEKLCNIFFKKLIERGRNARPEQDELPPLKLSRVKMCKHGNDSSSSSDSGDSLDEEGLQGYTDRIMLELQRKQSHPRRLHSEMWFNNTGEMNGGPLCRCSVRDRRMGMRHGVYAGEHCFPQCIPTQSNINSFYHYRITVSPPTNFLIKAPTIIGHDEHEFLFSGFSMFSHYKLAKLPKCKVIRFNIEYTILYVEEPAPQNFTIQELDLFEEYLFTELLELIDLDLGKATETSCKQFHFMPRFVRYLSEGGCEVLSMCEVLKYLVDMSGLLVPPDMLEEVHAMDHYNWLKYIEKIKGMIVTYPGKKPCSVRVDQLDRTRPGSTKDTKDSNESNKFYPEIVHFGIRPSQLSYAGNPEYQKAWRYYVKYRHLVANMAKPSYQEKQKLASKETKLQEMRTKDKMKRDVTVVISSEGFHTTGLMCDVVQHAMLIPVLVRHLRFHKSLDSLEEKIGYVFQQRALLQTALTHPSYRENFGTNPDHARNCLTNCGIRQPKYGDRRIHYTRKKGIVTLISIMSRFGKRSETESEIKHNERLEFLGDAVVEFLSSIHLFRMFPGLAEGGLATYRASIVQNQHLAQLAKNIGLEQYMLYAHGSDLCREVVMRHAMANCFEALMGALFLDAGLEVADRVFALALWHNEPDLMEVWTRDRPHPLQEQEPLGDRKYIKDFEFLQKLTTFEDSIGVQFKHIRLLARAFTDRSVGFTHLTMGSNQRLEFLGDTVLQLLVSDKLYKHFPDHHEGHLSLLRSSLVNNRTQALMCDDLDMSSYAIYNNPKTKPTTKKQKADLLEAFLGALFIDKNLEYCQVFCNACLFPRLQEFILNQNWNDPKSKLQQCCLTLRSMEGGEPDIPVYKVIECLGPTNTRVYAVGVYFRGERLAAGRGHSIQDAEMHAAERALSQAHELFPQLDHQKWVIPKIRKKKSKGGGDPRNQAKDRSRYKRKRNEDQVPKAYSKVEEKPESSDESSVHTASDDDERSTGANKSASDSGLDSDTETDVSKNLENVQVSSLLSDMERVKEDMIRRNEYEKLKEKCKRSYMDDD